MSEKHDIIKGKLNSVGCGFCLAKWTQVTMHLQTGFNHSCHHPAVHKIPLNQIDKDPSALHNTRYKKFKRKEMLEGKRPSECDYCWNIEDNSDSYSDRIYKSEEPWSQPYLEQIKNSKWDENFNPRYVEVSFSNNCNFKCSYCGPEYSTQWLQEIKKYGGYQISPVYNSYDKLVLNNSVPILHDEYNPYVEAFWKWFPELYRSLNTFRITGGEPLLSQDTWKVLDYIIDEKDPNRELKLAINSNLGVKDDLIDKLIEKLKILIDENKIKEVIIFTSADTWGKQAEYIRHGLEFDRFWNNINKLLTELPKLTITIMSTYNIMSPFSYNELIKNVYELKRKHCNNERYWYHPVLLDTSYLRYPQHMSVKLLIPEHKELILNNAETALYYGVPIFDRTHMGFTETETRKIKRIHDWSISDSNDIEFERQNFIKFIKEHDKRRNTNFLDVFPELEKLYRNYDNK